jgi:hypothetical protein
MAGNWVWRHGTRAWLVDFLLRKPPNSSGWAARHPAVRLSSLLYPCKGFNFTVLQQRPWCGALQPLSVAITEMNRICLVLFDMNNMIFGPALAAMHRILISVVDFLQVSRCLAHSLWPSWCGAPKSSAWSRRSVCLSSTWSCTSMCVSCCVSVFQIHGPSCAGRTDCGLSVAFTVQLWTVYSPPQQSVYSRKAEVRITKMMTLCMASRVQVSHYACQIGPGISYLQASVGVVFIFTTFITVIAFSPIRKPGMSPSPPPNPPTPPPPTHPPTHTQSRHKHFA